MLSSSLVPVLSRILKEASSNTPEHEHALPEVEYTGINWLSDEKAVFETTLLDDLVPTELMVMAR